MPLPQSLVPSTGSWPSLTKLSMQSPPENHCPWEPPGQDQPSAGQLQADSDGYPRTPYAWSTPHLHCFLPFSYRATLQPVRTKPLPSGTTTRSCSACVSTWTTPCCTGECWLLRVLGEPHREACLTQAGCTKAPDCLRQPNSGQHCCPNRLQDLSSGYWVLVVHFTRREAIRQIEVLQHVATNLGRSE